MWFFYSTFKLKFLGNEKSLNRNIIRGINFFVSIGNNSKRLDISNYIEQNQGNLINVINRSSRISRQVTLGNGNFIAKNSCINSNTVLENNIIINTSCVVEHDCKIESGVHIGPNATICGGVTIKEGTFIGANSIVKENTIIGENSLIGAGSVVLTNIPKNSLAYGNPCKVKDERK